jgi:hypothetical protein
LSKERFKLGTTYVVIEGTEVELAGCAVQDADTKTPVFSTLFVLSDRDTVTSLIVNKQLVVNQSSVGVDFI